MERNRMIIASVSTIPNRINGLLRVLESILYQSHRPNLVMISISKYYPRMKKSYPIDDYQELCNYLKTYSIPTKVIETEVDIGPVVKLLSPLQYLDSLSSHSYTHIFIFDDDSVPYKHAIHLLHQSFKKCGDAVYGLMGVNDTHLDIRPKFIHGEFIQHLDYVSTDILGGYRGVLYPIHLLSTLEEWVKPFLNAHHQRDMIAMHDDHIFAYYCQSKNIERRVITIENGNGMLFYEPIQNDDGIFNDTQSGDSYNLIQTILKSFV